MKARKRSATRRQPGGTQDEQEAMTVNPSSTRTVRTHTRQVNSCCADCGGNGCFWCGGSGLDPEPSASLMAAVADIAGHFAPDWQQRVELACDEATDDLDADDTRDTEQGYYTQSTDGPVVTVMFVEWGRGLEAAAHVHTDTGIVSMVRYGTQVHDPLALALDHHGFDVQEDA